MRNPSEEVTKVKNRKRARHIALAVAVLTAATPGVYSAWESAKAALKAKQEEVVRDRQEGDLQKNVRALAVAVEALRESSVTHKDLVDLVLKLRARRRPRHHGRLAPPVGAREQELERKLAALRKRAEVGARAITRAAAAKRAAPRLRPAKKVRQLVLRENGF